ncbi:hypothetical protein VN97_g11521 [Penicillium thymicola]|uniref:Uncharacterized protein n=1 Tax=Penicillium thymicola TaxID=293382 RepID=A0AAI9X3D8_PENTH|nr:hypothetical protein VN97_g11521 [Penicillium thymicola]
MPTRTGSHSRGDPLPSVPDSDFGGTISRNRPSFAALAQKTSNVLASSSGSTLRSSTSYGSLSKPHKPSCDPPFDSDTYVQLTGTSRSSSSALVDNLPNSLLKRRVTIQRLPTSTNETRPSPPAPKCIRRRQGYCA